MATTCLLLLPSLGVVPPGVGLQVLTDLPQHGSTATCQSLHVTFATSDGNVLLRNTVRRN